MHDSGTASFYRLHFWQGVCGLFIAFPAKPTMKSNVETEETHMEGALFITLSLPPSWPCHKSHTDARQNDTWWQVRGFSAGIGKKPPHG